MKQKALLTLLLIASICSGCSSSKNVENGYAPVDTRVIDTIMTDETMDIEDNSSSVSENNDIELPEFQIPHNNISYQMIVADATNDDNIIITNTFDFAKGDESVMFSLYKNDINSENNKSKYIIRQNSEVSFVNIKYENNDLPLDETKYLYGSILDKLDLSKIITIPIFSQNLINVIDKGNTTTTTPNGTYDIHSYTCEYQMDDGSIVPVFMQIDNNKLLRHVVYHIKNNSFEYILNEYDDNYFRYDTNLSIDETNLISAEEVSKEIQTYLYH